MVDPVTMFKEGGEFMYVILAVGVFAMAIAFERLFYIVFRANINATAFMAQIQKLIMANNIDRAIKLCNAEPHAALPRVVKAGLTRANRTEKEIENAIDEATLEVGPLVNKRTAYLAMLANIATLTGLLGTIMGLIIAFNAVAKASAEVKQAMLANGISVAMFTTAGGLMVAIPTLVLHSIITNRSNKILDDIDQYGLKTVNLLTARRRGSLKDEAAADM
ncbi:MAG: MotA/TolQ/ExbB proton channel family protein [Myxococcales bacterium]|nr:MotA/TolQ/ExbB proton channel family protein [Myxococcales bacterium]